MSWEKFVVVGDNHGDMCSEKDVDVLFDFVAEWKPKHRIHLGDNWDLRPLRAKATERDKASDTDKDWAAGKSFLLQYNPTVFLLGNHDNRIWKAREDANGAVRHYATQCVDEIKELIKTKKLATTIYPYHSRLGVYKLGDLSFVHGYHCGGMACRRHAEVYGNVIFGHVHTVEQLPVPRLERVVARTIGCLADIDKLEYAENNTNTLRWANGFGYGVVNTKTGNTIVWQAEKISGQWILPTHVKVV
jgi:predicted phosphodiesterase